VTGLVVDGGAVSGVETESGAIRCEQVVVAPGPWVRDFWRMLELPPVIARRDVPHPQAEYPMWTYSAQQEAILGADPALLVDNSDASPPVVHVESDAPLHDDVDGSLITDEPWSIYFKFDAALEGLQGGAMPCPAKRRGDEVSLDPYGTASPDFVVREDFARLWTSGLAHCLQRFAGMGQVVTQEPRGGLACHTPDGLPVFDVFRQNAYVIADANHGYQLIGVGALVAEELLGKPQELLEPFRFSRYAAPG
jgi:glycine/D-amino acid oxidase-like deaminating enzyme